MRLLKLAFQSILALVVISLIAFTIITKMPSDPVHIAIHLWNLPADDATILRLRSEWGLEGSLGRRYLHWLTGFVQGDWGRSFRTGEAVFDEFMTRLPISLLLGFSGLILAFIFAVPLGFFSALRPNGIADRLCVFLSVIVQTIPGFLLGLILLWWLGASLRLLRPFANDASAFVLPIIIMALHSLAFFSRIYRHDMIEASRRPYFYTALAKGLSRRQALLSHTHHSALYALVAAIRSQAGWVIGSTATMEVLFNLPGISQFLVQSIGARDQNVLQAYVMVVALWMLLMNFCVHSAMMMLEPRLKAR